MTYQKQLLCKTVVFLILDVMLYLRFCYYTENCVGIWDFLCRKINYELKYIILPKTFFNKEKKKTNSNDTRTLSLRVLEWHTRVISTGSLREKDTSDNDLFCPCGSFGHINSVC